MPAWNPTQQQTDILDAVATGEDVVVDALAGSGKTSTLELIARAHPDAKMTYAAFNRSIADDAAGRFPRNVIAGTAHSFAYRHVMTARPALADRLANQERIPRWKVAQILGVPEEFSFGTQRLRSGQLAGLVMEALGRFCSSSAPEPSMLHFPRVPGLDRPDAAQALEELLFPFLLDAWEDVSADRGKLRFDHSCQPLGTMVRVASYTPGGGMGVGGSRTQWREVPIEDIQVGDMVVSWTPRSRRGVIRRSGRRVNAIGSRPFSGNLIQVKTTNNRFSSYTPDHICVARLDAPLTQGNYVVYLAKRGAHFRIGRTTWRTESQSNNNGLFRRADSQDADAVWVLSVHGSDSDAALSEALLSYNFGVPTWQFVSKNQVMPLDKFWAEVGLNADRAEACLSSVGRDIRFPLWSRGAGRRLTTPVEIRACNLMSGFKVCEMDEVTPLSNSYLVCNEGSGGWSSIEVSLVPYEGPVYNLDVDVDHTYVADGIVTHNCYLKLASMDESFRLPGSKVLFDEAQDADGVVLYIVRRMQDEHGVQVIAVGDSNQQVYAWRNAIDSLGKFDTRFRLPLTKSWRFGPPIAEEANRILSLLPTDLRVEGNEAVTSALAELEAPDVVLCRTNAEAVARMLTAQVAGIPTGLVGGTQQVEWLAQAALDLTEGRLTDHPELRAFETWAMVQKYVEEDHEARDLQVLVRIVDRYGPERLLEAVHAAVPEASASLLLSTAHKAKGREWSRVLLAGDFDTPLGERGDLLLEELRLAYVAVTRGKNYVDSSSLDWIDFMVAPENLGERKFLSTDEVPAREQPRRRVASVAQVMIDPESEHRVIITGTKYDADLVEAQRGLPSDMRPSYRGEYAGFEKVRVVNAGYKVLQLAERFNLTVAPDARERIDNYS